MPFISKFKVVRWATTTKYITLTLVVPPLKYVLIISLHFTSSNLTIILSSIWKKERDVRVKFRTRFIGWVAGTRKTRWYCPMECRRIIPNYSRFARSWVGRSSYQQNSSRRSVIPLTTLRRRQSRFYTWLEKLLLPTSSHESLLARRGIIWQISFLWFIGREMIFRRPNSRYFLVPILSDKYVAAVGIVMCDAGKQGAIFRFISLRSVCDALLKKDPSWAGNLKYLY